MNNREEIFQKVQDILVDLFEVEADVIDEETLLYEGLDIDSIDAVDMIVELKKYTGIKITPNDFKSVRTVGDVVNAVCDLLEK